MKPILLRDIVELLSGDIELYFNGSFIDAVNLETIYGQRIIINNETWLNYKVENLVSDMNIYGEDAVLEIHLSECNEED